MRDKLAANYADALNELAEQRGYGLDIEDAPEIAKLVIDFQDAGPRELSGMQYFAADVDIDTLPEKYALRFPVASLFATGASENQLGVRSLPSTYDAQVNFTLRIWLEWDALDGREPTFDKYRKDAQLVADAIISAINGDKSETSCVLGGTVSDVSFGPLQFGENGERQLITFAISARVSV